MTTPTLPQQAKPLTFRFITHSWLIGWPVFWHERRAIQHEKAALRHRHAMGLRANRLREMGIERGIR